MAKKVNRVLDADIQRSTAPSPWSGWSGSSSTGSPTGGSSA